MKKTRKDVADRQTVRRTARWILFLSLLLVIFIFSDGLTTQSDAITEKEIRDAVLGRKPVNVNTMDINKDSKVDVADVVKFLNAGLPTDLWGYVWVVAATFTPTPQQNTSPRKGIPSRYPFAISIAREKVVTTAVPGFNATKGILRQNVSGPGQVPGVNRPPNCLSKVIPENTTFSYTESAEGKVTLTSGTAVIPANDPKNPAGVELQRSWTISIDKKALLAGSKKPRND